MMLANKEKDLPYLYIKRTFSLSSLEFLLSLFFIAIIAGISFALINPVRNFAETRNAKRSVDIAQISSALNQYTAAENFVSELEVLPCEEGGSEIGENAFSISSFVIPNYLLEIPFDPQNGNELLTGYSLCQEANGKYKITALYAENGKTIELIF